MCICITDWVCCTPETNTTLSIIYTPIKILRFKKMNGGIGIVLIGLWTFSHFSLGNIFPDGSVGKKPTCSAVDTGDLGWILDQKDLLEEEMATHSSTLAWRIPWTEEANEATVCGVTKSQTQLKWLNTYTERQRKGKFEADLLKL